MISKHQLSSSCSTYSLDHLLSLGPAEQPWPHRQDQDGSDGAGRLRERRDSAQPGLHPTLPLLRYHLLQDGQGLGRSRLAPHAR